MLLSPSVLGLLFMLDICVYFRLCCNVTFNAKESICIAVIRKKLQAYFSYNDKYITGLDT